MAFIPFEKRTLTPLFGNQSNAVLRPGLSIQPNTNYNRGGLSGALQYVGGKAMSGVIGTLEGIYDFTVGGIAKAAGNDGLAKELMGNQLANDFSRGLEYQYNPSKGMRFAGDVASGIGQSTVGMAVAAGAGAISGGTLSPFVIGMISGGTIGLGAAGQATAEAYQTTGELGGREFLYGGVSGLLEGSLEALTGSAGKVASRIVSPFAKTTAKTVVRQGILKTMVKEGAGEFIEEALSTFIDPYLQRGLKIDENAKNASIGDILYSGLVGFTSGALLSGASTSAMNIRKADVGAKVITNGNVDKLVTNARETVAYATENKQIKEQIGSLQATLNTYENLKDKSTTRAKILLGELSQGLAVSDVSIQVDKIKQNIVANAEKYATYFTNKGVSITAEEIKADKKDVATKLAIMEYSGKFALSENDYNNVSDKGALELNKDGFKQWQNDLDNSTSQRLSSQLGVDVKGVDYDTVKNAVQRYNTQQQAIQQPTVPSGDIIKPNTLSATNLARNANNTATTQSSEQAIVLALQDKAVSAKEINDINTFIKDKNVKVSYYYDKSQGAADGVYINGVLEINLASKEGVFNTAIHEYAHYLEETSPKLLEDYLKQVDKLIETNPKYKAIADKWTEIYNTNEKTKGISPKDLRVEIALKISKELIDNNADFKAIVNKNLTVGQRLLLWFKNMFNRFRKSGLTAEARAVKKAVDALQTAIKTVSLNKKQDASVSVKYSLPSESPYRTTFPKPKGEYTKAKIIRYLKDGIYHNVSKLGFAKELLNYGDAKSIEQNLYYHGTGSGFGNRLIPSIIIPRFDESSGGGGYGDKYWGISLSKSRNTASNFTSNSRYGTVYDVLLRKDAKVKELPQVQDAVELEDFIIDLWKEGVDAVKIGNWETKTSEQEIVILNPAAIIVGEGKSFAVFQKQKEHNKTIQEIETMIAEASKTIEESRKRHAEKKEINKEKKINDIIALDNSFNRQDLQKQSYTELFSMYWDMKSKKTKYSLPDTDSQGRKLTEAQREFFKDSKVIDEQGRLLEVYHDTNAKAYVNIKTGENWNEVGWKEKESWEQRSDWDKYWKAQDFYTFSKKNARRSIEMPAYFFSPIYDKYHEYGERTIKSYLNLTNPAINPTIKNAGVTDNAGADAMNKLIKQGYDGFIRTDDDGNVLEYAVFNPNQIKLTTNLNPTANEDIRYSLPDTEYLELAKNPEKNKAMLQEMVDEAAKKAMPNSNVTDKDGKLRKVYHQTEGGFTIFDVNRKGAGQHDYLTPFGIFTKPNANDIGLKGKKQIGLYINIVNPLIFENRSELEAYLKSNANIGSLIERIKTIDRDYGKKYEDANKEWNKLIKEDWDSAKNEYKGGKEVEDAYEKTQAILDEWGNAFEIQSAALKNIVNMYFRNTQNDGIILKEDGGSFERKTGAYIALNSNQVKSADPVTYDDNGNIIPLGERFKSNIEDIRYSLPPTNPKRSEGELSKYIANNTSERVYAKTDAEAVLTEIVKKRLALGDRYGAGFTNAKSLDEAVNSLWIALNRATKANQINIAVDIADYILESVVLTDFYKDDAVRNKREDAENKLSAIRPYYRKISARSLDAIAEDVRYAFGDTKSFAVWKTTNGGVAIDALPDVLREEGIQIKAENAQDIFIELETIRQESNATLQASKEAEKVSISQLVANGAISKDALSVMQNEIAYKIMDTFASGGDLSTYGKLLAKVKDTTKALRNALAQEKERSNSLLQLYRNINYVKNFGKYTEASSPIPEEIKAIIKPISQIVTNKGNLNQNVRTIMRSYAQQVVIDGTEQQLYNFMFDGTNPFAYQINAIAQGKGQLTIQEIQWMNDIVKSFIFGVKNYNRVFFDNKKQEAIDVSEVGIKETNKAKAVTDAKVLSSINTVKNWMSAPIWRFQRLGMYNDNSVAVKMFNELKKGVDRQSQFNMNVANHFNPFFKKYKKEVNSWRNETMTVGSKTLIDMYPNNKLTKGQAISLYLLSQREQAKGHLYNIGNGTGKVRVVLDKAGLSGRKAFQGGTDIGISEADIQTLYDKFGEAEKEFIKLAQEFFDTIARDAKVETDGELYGVSNVEEGHYFPIRVSSDELFKELGKSWDSMSDLFTVYSPSFNKQTRQNAKNKIVIENVLDVVNRHARQMSAYYGLATPIKMISKIFNVKHADGSTLRKSIAEIDPDFERYINKLFIDIQGNVPAREGIDKVVSKVRSMGATAALGLNPKVLMNQFVSLFASHGNGISYKNIALGFKSMFARNKAAEYKILYKYSPMAYDRAREGSNIDVGLLKAEAGFVGKMNKLSEITTGIIGKVDSLVVFGVWNAAIEQTRNDSNYEYKSDAHYKEAAKLLDDTIIKTQANYIPLYRPEILRQQNSLLQLSTMFMSEPLQVFSQLAASVERANLARYELKNAKTAIEKARAEAKVKSANKYARGVATAVIVDSIVLSLIAILANYVKGKDDEEEFWEQFGQNMLENAVGMFPFVRDIYSYMQGYDVSNMFYTGLENIGLVFTNAKKIFTGEFTVGHLRKTVVGVAQTFGIPLRNLETYTMGAINLFSPETAYKYWDIFYKQNYRKNLDKAIQKNDDKMAKTVLSNMVKDKGVTVNDKATAEMLRLYKLGLDTIPKALNQTITIDGESRSLTNSQYKQFATTYGKAATEINKLMSTVEYSSLDDEGKANAMRYVYESYYNKGLKETLGIENKTTAATYLFDITQYSIYKAYASTVESDKDKKGNTINGSKKKKIIAYIQKLNIPNAQKALLVYLEGYTISDGELKGFTAVSAKRAVINYINGSSIGAAEKEALTIACGFKFSNGKAA